MPTIKVEIESNGKVNMHYAGFTGEECDIAEGNVIQKLKNLSMSNTGETKERFEDRKMEMENP